MLKKLSAIEELSVPKEVNNLIPLLLKKSLALEQAEALANNVVILFFSLENREGLESPFDILLKYSLEEIADLVSSQNSFTEYGYNQSFREGDC